MEQLINVIKYKDKTEEEQHNFLVELEKYSIPTIEQFIFNYNNRVININNYDELVLRLLDITSNVYYVKSKKYFIVKTDNEIAINDTIYLLTGYEAIITLKRFALELIQAGYNKMTEIVLKRGANEFMLVQQITSGLLAERKYKTVPYPSMDKLSTPLNYDLVDNALLRAIGIVVNKDVLVFKINDLITIKEKDCKLLRNQVIEWLTKLEENN